MLSFGSIREYVEILDIAFFGGMVAWLILYWIGMNVISIEKMFLCCSIVFFWMLSLLFAVLDTSDEANTCAVFCAILGCFAILVASMQHYDELNKRESKNR